MNHRVFVKVFNEILNAASKNNELRFQAEEIENPDTYMPLCACTPVKAYNI